VEQNHNICRADGREILRSLIGAMINGPAEREVVEWSIGDSGRLPCKVSNLSYIR
jgi:hypothetical protein